MTADVSPFISCEDTLPSLWGLSNAYAFVTATMMMVVPLRSVYQAFTTTVAEVKTTTATVKEGPSLLLRPYTTQLPLFFTTPYQVHTVCLLALFCGNLVAHAKGLTMRPTFDRLPSWYTISGALCLWGSKNGSSSSSSSSSHNDNNNNNNSVDVLPLMCLTLAIWFVVQITLMTHVEWTVERQVYEIVEGVTNLYIITTMGRRSWSTKPLRQHFLSCLACFGMLQAVTAVEPNICNIEIGNDRVWVIRLYHAILDHSLISILFHRVTNLMFKLNTSKTEKTD